MSNQDQLVEITSTDRIIIDDGAASPTLLRGAIWQMVQEAAARLPDESQLKIQEAHRSQSRQFRYWNRRMMITARENPDWDLEQLITECRRWTADPVDRPSGHQAGAAVDITILENGEEIDVGCGLGEINDKTPMTCEGLTEAQIANRKRLKDLMESVGFLNYDEEWWHYSYNDRLWAEMKLHGTDTGTVGPEHYVYTAVPAY